MQDCTHISSNVEVENNNPLDRMIIEYANEDSKDEYKHIIIHTNNHEISMLPYKGKCILTNNEIVVGIAK